MAKKSNSETFMVSGHVPASRKVARARPLVRAMTQVGDEETMTTAEQMDAIVAADLSSARSEMLEEEQEQGEQHEQREQREQREDGEF